jgi:hypothetical protein
LATREVHGGQLAPHFADELVDPTGEISRRPTLTIGLVSLLFEFAGPVSDGLAARLELGQRDRTCLESVEEPGLLRPQLGELADGVDGGGTVVPGSAVAQDQLGVLEVSQHLSPDELVEFVGTSCGLRATKVICTQMHGQRGGAAVGAVQSLALLSLVSLTRLTTLPATHEVAQEVAVRCHVARTEGSVAAVLGLRTRPGLQIDDGRDADSDPVLFGPRLSHRSVVSGVMGKTRRLGVDDATVVVEGPGVGALAEHGPNRPRGARCALRRGRLSRPPSVG